MWYFIAFKKYICSGLAIYLGNLSELLQHVFLYQSVVLRVFWDFSVIMINILNMLQVKLIKVQYSLRLDTR